MKFNKIKIEWVVALVLIVMALFIFTDCSSDNYNDAPKKSKSRPKIEYEKVLTIVVHYETCESDTITFRTQSSKDVICGLRRNTSTQPCYLFGYDKNNKRQAIANNVLSFDIIKVVKAERITL